MIENIHISSIADAEDILKSAGSEELFKSVAEIGEIRHWGDGEYKKVDKDKWVKVVGDKTRSVSNSTIKKRIIRQMDLLRDNLNERRLEFIKTVLSTTNNTLRDRVFAESCWKKEISNNDILRKQEKELVDLEDEYREILSCLYKEEKKKREIKAGKREIDSNDIKTLIKGTDEFLAAVVEKFPKMITPREAMPNVSVDNYYLDTKTVFTTIKNETVGIDELKSFWDEMKNNKEYEHHGSPKSSSEYLINRKTGDVFRFSDHWGSKIASCSWFLDEDNVGAEKFWVVAKSNISDFERKDGNATYSNPVYVDAIVRGAKQSFSVLSKLVSENKDYYLSADAKKIVQYRAKSIYSKCQVEVGSFENTLIELRKKYINIFE